MPVGFTEVTALVSGIKGTIEIAKGLKSAYDAHAIAQAQTQLLESLLSIQGDALTLQERYSNLIREKDELAKKLTEYENWADTQSRYKLKRLTSGAVVYSYIKTNENTEPPHWLCPTCFSERTKSILQSFNDMGNYWTHHCPRCKFEFGGASFDLMNNENPDK